MHHRTLKLTLLLCMILLSSACNKDATDIQEPISTVSSIVTIGDSIGNGYGMATPWPTLIQASLAIPLFNRSISGKETGWGLEQINTLLDQHKPSHVLILLGTNDATRGPSIEAAVSNLQKMVDIANANDVIALVGTVIPNRRSEAANVRAIQLSDRIRSLKGAVIVETRLAMNDGQGLLVDGVHPNDAGQKLIADAFLNSLASPIQTSL